MKTLTFLALAVMVAPLVMLVAAFWPVLEPLVEARRHALEASAEERT